MSERIPIRVAQVGCPPVFDPWQGDEFVRVRTAGEAECCTPNWHLMGESHYGSPEKQDAGMTRRVMRDLAIPGYRFFDTVLSVATNKPIAEIDRAVAWQRFAYSNFVQDVLPPSGRPTDDQWARARTMFFGQLAITRPKLLLVIGRMQWGELPTEGYTKLPPVPSVAVDDDDGVDDVGLYAYEHDGLTTFTIVTWIYHPSSRSRLNIADAQLRVRSVGMSACNILSSIEQMDTGYEFVNGV